MTGRYYQRDFEELYYIIDSEVISEEEFDEKQMYDGYGAFEDSLTGEEIVDLLNENEQLKEIITGQRDTIKRDNEWENKAIEEIKQLKSDLIDHSALLSMLEDYKALKIEEILWNLTGVETEEEFNKLYKPYLDKAKECWSK